MAQILFERASGEMALISIDATMEEAHESSALVTEHAVETGANVSDHIRAENDRLTLNFMISNTPIKVPGSHLDGVTGQIAPMDLFFQTSPRRSEGNPKMVGSFVPGSFVGFGIKTLPSKVSFDPQPLVRGTIEAEGATVLQFSGTFDRVRAVYEELLNLSRNGTLVQIVTGIRTYENMAIVSVSAPRDAAHGNAIVFSLNAVQVRLAETQTVAAPEPEETRGRRNVARGGQPTAETDNGPRASLWHNLMSSAGIL